MRLCIRDVPGILVASSGKSVLSGSVALSMSAELWDNNGRFRVNEKQTSMPYVHLFGMTKEQYDLLSMRSATSGPYSLSFESSDGLIREEMDWMQIVKHPGKELQYGLEGYFKSSDILKSCRTALASELQAKYGCDILEVRKVPDSLRTNAAG